MNEDRLLEIEESAQGLPLAAAVDVLELCNEIRRCWAFMERARKVLKLLIHFVYHIQES